MQMREYSLDLQTRLTDTTAPESMPEVLAFAEGRLLSIHPFADFNGRLARLWLWELMRRLRLPPVQLVSTDPGCGEPLPEVPAGGGSKRLSPAWRTLKHRLTQGGQRKAATGALLQTRIVEAGTVKTPAPCFFPLLHPPRGVGCSAQCFGAGARAPG